MRLNGEHLPNGVVGCSNPPHPHLVHVGGWFFWLNPTAVNSASGIFLQWQLPFTHQTRLSPKFYEQEKRSVKWPKFRNLTCDHKNRELLASPQGMEPRSNRIVTGDRLPKSPLVLRKYVSIYTPFHSLTILSRTLHSSTQETLFCCILCFQII